MSANPSDAAYPSAPGASVDSGEPEAAQVPASGRVVPAPAGSWDGTHSWRGSWEKAPTVERSSAADNANADRAGADWATTDPQTTADTMPHADWQRVEGAAPNLTEFSSLFWIDDDESVVKRDRRSPRLLGLATALLLSVLAAVFTAFMLTDSPDGTDAVVSGPGHGLAPAETPAGISSDNIQTDEPIGAPTDDAQVTTGSDNSDQVPGPLEATGAAESVDDPLPVGSPATAGAPSLAPTSGPTTPSGSPTSGGTDEPASQPSSEPSSQPSPSPSESDSGGLLSSVVGLIGWLLG